jgi:hypothetical protein
MTVDARRSDAARRAGGRSVADECQNSLNLRGDLIATPSSAQCV